MCGICGEITFDGRPASGTRIERMADSLAPRGPDDCGIVTRGRVGFGHRRLSIIDLSEKGAQPFVDTALGLTIAFNGCIYNYPELRRELAAKGYNFASHSDTEVILNQELGEPFRRDAMKKPTMVAGINPGDMRPQKGA